MSTTETTNDDRYPAHLTPGCRALYHLLDLCPEKPDGSGEPDPGICAADTYPDEWVKLVRELHHIRDAAAVIESRYQQDVSHGGALTTIAERVRDEGSSALEKLWESACGKYIAATLEANRQPWDCPYCGADAPPEPEVFEVDRCPECLSTLWFTDDEDGWQ
jgi:hypothetical protein